MRRAVNSFVVFKYTDSEITGKGSERNSREEATKRGKDEEKHVTISASSLRGFLLSTLHP
jgi:hypothetical protein